MERRVKLIIAGIALVFLVAGMVRRWSKEGQWPVSLTGGNLAASPKALTDPNDMTAGDPYMAATPPWPHAGRDQVSPAASLQTAPMIAHTGEEPIDEGVMRASYLPNPPAPSPSSAPVIAHTPTPRVAPPSSPTTPAYPQTSYPPAAPTLPSNHYVIQPNDSFWTISERVYGTAKYFQALFEHNRRICPQPDRLQPGVMIETPPYHALERSYPDLFR